MQMQSMSIRWPAALAAIATLGLAGPSQAAPRCGGPDHIRCDDGFYCQTAAGECQRFAALGRCERKPQVCDFLENPVCGCNGVTYANTCAAAEAGVNIAHRKACTRPPPFIGIPALHPPS